MNLMKLITKRRSERFVDHGHFTNLIVYLEEKKHPSLQDVCASCFFPCRRSGLLQAVQHPTAFYCRTSDANGSGAAG